MINWLYILSHRLQGLMAGVWLVMTLPVNAEVVEALHYERYTANHQQGETLLQSLNRATPIRLKGQRFHGQTNWTIHWKYRWDRQPSGRCTLRSNQTHLNITITMPQLVSADAAARTAFQRYHGALQQHELRHADFGREAAREIDSRIRTAPSMASCEDLERHINQLGHRLIGQAGERERAYDQRTRHGSTEGASLLD